MSGQRQVDNPPPFDVRSLSALSESDSKSACAFPVISSASLVRASSVSRRSLRSRSRASSTASGADLGGAGLGYEGVDGAGRPGPSPLGQMRRVQALAVQQGTALVAAAWQRVVLVEDAGLVLAAERSPSGLGRRVVLTHATIWARWTNDAVVIVTVYVISGLAL